MATEKKTRYIYKKQGLFQLVDKIKLWPARSGMLHGVKSVENHGESMIVTTHCGETFIVWNSRTSRSARWLRNRWCTSPCPKCGVPQWKLDKYSQTIFSNTKGGK